VIFSTINSKRIFAAGRLGLTALVVGYAMRTVDWGSLQGTLRQVKLLPLTAAIGLQGCAIAVAAARWRVLLAAQAIHLSWLRTVQFSLVGLFFSLFSLGTLGGDAAKFIGLLPHAPKRKGLLVLSMVQDRLIGLGGLLALLTGFIAVQRHLLWSDPTMRALTLALPVACAVFFGGAAMLWTLHGSPQTKDPGPARRWQNSLSIMARNFFPLSAFLPALLLSVAVHALIIATGYLAARAIGIDLPFSAAGIVFGTTGLVLSLPITVAGLGVREGALIWLLGLFGFGAIDLAIGLSFCLLSSNLFWAFTGGVAFYWPAANPRTSSNISG